MAGDWIKVEHATATKPEVSMAAELLGITRREMVGLLLDYWIWLDSNLHESCNGLVTQVSRRSIEDIMHCPGFAAVLERMKWAYFDDEERILTVINWERHSGSTAKSRASGNQRVKRFRNAPTVTESLPEKRREEKSKDKTLMSGSQANTDAVEVLQFLNDKTGRHFRNTPATLKPILARLKEGNDVATCKAVVVRRWRAWKDDAEMREYLRPDTLFNATKFAQYVGEVPADAL